MSLSGSRKRKVYSQTNKWGNLALLICNAQLQSQLRLRTHTLIYTHTQSYILVCACVSVCIKYSLVFHTAPLAAEQFQRASATDHLGREGMRAKRYRTPEEFETCCGFYTKSLRKVHQQMCDTGKVPVVRRGEKKREKWSWNCYFLLGLELAADNSAISQSHCDLTLLKFSIIKRNKIRFSGHASAWQKI